MDKKRSEEISIDIANIIASSEVIIDYGERENPLEYVMDVLCKGLSLDKVAGSEYVEKLKAQARCFEPEEFNQDPFIKNVKVTDTKIGEFLLTNATYAKGEIFQYDEPDVHDDIVVPKLGFFTGKVDFPTIYEDVIPWMSVCPSEINSMKKDMERATGRVLVLGLGLGYYPYIISQRDDVEEITIVEFQPEIIKMFEEKLLPQFNMKEKIKVVEADAFKFMMEVEPGQYDFIFADIWENQFDGAIAYRKIHEHEERLIGTQFGYWIEEEILYYLETIDY